MSKTSTFVNPLYTSSADSESADRVARARRAYEVAKAQKNAWQAFARMLTRNPNLKLELTGGTPCTDGETIWLRVPIELGDELPHDRKLCGTRNPVTKRMLCSACDILDGIDCTQNHEVGHITAESFQAIPDADLAGLLKKAIQIEAEGMPESARAKKLEREFDRQRPRTFVHAANLISPWLGVLLNAVEDARVNEHVKQAWPGTAIMFQAQTVKIFEEGIEQMDGTRAMWKEQPLNMQAVIGVYCQVSSLDYSTWLCPEIVEALDDPEIADITLRAKTARSVGSVFHQSVRYLEALRRLGYCKTEEDIEDDPSPDGEPGEPNGDPKPGEGDGDGGDGESGEPSDGESGSSGGSGPKTDDLPPPSPADSKPGSGSDDTDDAESDDTDDGDDDGSGSGDDTTEDDSDAEGAGKDDGSDGADDDSDGNADSADSGDDSTDSDEEWDGSNPEHVDTGMDEGKPERLPMGTPTEAERGLAIFGRHDEDGSVDTGNDPVDTEEIERAIAQADYFDAPSENIYGVTVHEDGATGRAWTAEDYSWSGRKTTGSMDIPETILSPSLLRLRRAFQANQRGSYERDRKNGSVDGRILGKRVLSDDYRWFKARREPGKRDYFVLIGLDVSGSTSRPGVIDLIKKAAYAQAELCSRLGVKFAVYAHTGDYETGKGLMLDMYVVKSPKDRWDTAAKTRLTNLRPASANLDGHTMEFYRKVLDGVSATDKVMLYYTDGAMPMENFREELNILQREIDTCRKRRYKVVGVGVKNDDPTKHGLDTIRIDKLEDIPMLVDGLEKRLRP